MTKELWKQLKQNNSFSQTHWPTFTILTFDVLLSLISWRISFLSAPFFVFSQLLLCLALFHSYLILHEAAHSAVAQNRSVNDLVGQICGWFLFMPFLSRQSSHLLHHTWAGHPRRDPANNRMIQKFSVITPKEVKHLEFVWKYWFPAIIINDRIGLWRAPFQQSDSGLKSPRVKSEIRWAYLYAAFYFLVGSFILFSGSAQHFFLWYLPALFVCFLVEELANLPHHAETKLLDDSDKALPYWEQHQVTHSCKNVPVWSRFVLLNFNMHTAHHLFPTAPWYGLPELQNQIRLICPDIISEHETKNELEWSLLNRRKPLLSIMGHYFYKIAQPRSY